MARRFLTYNVNGRGVLQPHDNVSDENTMTRRFVTYNVEDQKAGLIPVDEKGVLQPHEGTSSTNSEVIEKDVNFYDYDGTLLHSYTVAEAQELTNLPSAPTHDGLVFQGWNHSLENVKALTRAMNIGAMYATDDGKTRIYISLLDGCTSPMLGIGVNGMVDVDWGDGTEHTTLTGEDVATTVWTDNHNYADPGDYVIKLTVNGEAAFTGSMLTDEYSNILRFTNAADYRNHRYYCAMTRLEIGNGVTTIADHAFNNHRTLKLVTIPNTVVSIGECAFAYCNALESVVVPNSITSIIQEAFTTCINLATIILPDSLVEVGNRIFEFGYALRTITFPESVVTMGGYLFNSCKSLQRFVVPSKVTNLGNDSFARCDILKEIELPRNLMSIGFRTFNQCYGLSSTVVIPSGVAEISSNTFARCYGVKCYDFSNHVVVPTLGSVDAFDRIAEDCVIRVPSALYDEWIAAANWSTYTSNIVAV